MKPILSLLILLFPAALGAQTITLGTPSGLDFCKGASITVPYTASGQFAADNQFVLQISNDGFNTYTYIGVNSGMQGTITGAMNTPGKYRVRVVSSDPFVASADNDTDINVSAPPVPDVRFETWQGGLYPMHSTWAVGATEDTVRLSDAEPGNLGYIWQLDQDATPVTDVHSSAVGVMYAHQGQKTGTVTAIASPGCSTTTSFTYIIFDCNPIITKKAHVVTGIEAGGYDSVWIKPGAQYTDNYGATVFIESGASLIANHDGVGHFFVKRGGSITFAKPYANPYIIEDSGISLTPPDNTEGVFHCNSLQFTREQSADVATSDPEAFDLTQSGDQLQIKGTGSIEVHVYDILGKELLSRSGANNLSVDASGLPSGVCLVKVTGTRSTMTHRIVLTHE